jgi:hypothetical protein
MDNIMHNEKLPELIWYGERGIINSILTHMQQSKAGFVEEVRKLINKIQWANGKPADWVASITSAYAIVELGFGQFGDPDLIFVCDSSMGQKYILFIEAKAKTYRDSMMPNQDPGMRARGFNSRINGQLNLKYRFAQAVIAANEGRTEWVEEPRELWECYIADQLKDPIPAPRRLKKDNIISKILKPLMSGITSNASFRYVALTWDTEIMAFFRDDEVTDDFLPRFLDPSDGHNLYQEMQSQIGWLGYRNLEEALGLNENSTYRLAFETMLSGTEPSKKYYDRKAKQAIENLPENIKALIKELKTFFNPYRVDPGAGSHSVKNDANSTVAKIIPRRTKVFVGFRVDKANENMIAEKIDMETAGNSARVNIRGVEFMGYEVTIKDKDRNIEVARKLVESWKLQNM